MDIHTFERYGPEGIIKVYGGAAFRLLVCRQLTGFFSFLPRLCHCNGGICAQSKPFFALVKRSGTVCSSGAFGHNPFNEIVLPMSQV